METKKDIQLIQYKEIYRNNKNSKIIYKLGLVNDYNILLRISINILRFIKLYLFFL